MRKDGLENETLTEHTQIKSRWKQRVLNELEQIGGNTRTKRYGKGPEVRVTKALITPPPRPERIQHLKRILSLL